MVHSEILITVIASEFLSAFHLPIRPSPVRACQCRPASALQVIFTFEPRSDLLHHFATIGIVYRSFLHDLHLPSVAVKRKSSY
jgi:hypothetical protein